MELFFIIFGLYLIQFLISIKIKDNSIADVFWGMGFMVIATYLYLGNSQFELLATGSLLLIIFWGLRLSYFVLKRKLKEKSEDPRYYKWRQTWKYFYTRSFFQVYLLQMIIMLIVSFPIYFIFSGDPLNIYLFLLGSLISIIGLAFEIISDNQVKKYIQENGKTNKVFTGGLYKYTRNPNYFGESLFWLGLSIIGSSVSMLSFIGFLTITFLLLFVSGVPMKEERQSKKSNWYSYKEKTSVFIPWFPKK